jgi:hypothetical protein
LLSTLSVGAQDATWLSNPGSNDLDSGPNWSTGAVPTGTASFGASNTTALISSADNTFSGWIFNERARCLRSRLHQVTGGTDLPAALEIVSLSVV